MKREIKFRAWDENKKVIFDVDAIYFKGCYESRFGYFENDFGCETGSGDHGERQIIRMSSVLIQFTGLKDKNGKEIYEGDIVIHANVGEKGVVTWGSSLWMVMQKANTGHDIEYSCSALDDGSCNFLEIIGNIYENSDLLK